MNRPIISRRTRGSRSLGDSVSSTELLDNTRTCHPLLPCATLFTAKRTTITMAASACPPLHPRCFHCVSGAWPGRSLWVGIGKGTAQAKAKAAMSSVLRTSGNLWCEGSETSSQFAHGPGLLRRLEVSYKPLSLSNLAPTWLLLYALILASFNFFHLLLLKFHSHVSIEFCTNFYLYFFIYKI